jgi:hypothetical protein
MEVDGKIEQLLFRLRRINFEIVYYTRKRDTAVNKKLAILQGLRELGVENCCDLRVFMDKKECAGRLNWAVGITQSRK